MYNLSILDKIFLVGTAIQSFFIMFVIASLTAPGITRAYDWYRMHKHNKRLAAKKARIRTRELEKLVFLESLKKEAFLEDLRSNY